MTAAAGFEEARAPGAPGSCSKEHGSRALLLRCVDRREYLPLRSGACDPPRVRHTVVQQQNARGARCRRATAHRSRTCASTRTMRGSTTCSRPSGRTRRAGPVFEFSCGPGRENSGADALPRAERGEGAGCPRHAAAPTAAPRRACAGHRVRRRAHGRLCERGRQLRQQRDQAPRGRGKDMPLGMRAPRLSIPSTPKDTRSATKRPRAPPHAGAEHLLLGASERP